MNAARALTCALLALALSGCARRACGDDPFVCVVGAIRPSVVLFTMKVPSDDRKRRGQFDDAYGSGVVVGGDAHGSQILTAAHVLEDARNLRVRADDGRESSVRLLARNDDLDLALVQTPLPNLRPVRLARAGTVVLGEAIGVAGYPVPDDFIDDKLGVSISVFAGRVAGLNNDALELDLPILPGESGGPVFDARTGEVIGLAQSRFDDEHAIGFAIPIEDVRRFLRGHVSDE